MNKVDNLRSFLNIPEEVKEIELGKDKTDTAKFEADNDIVKMLFDIALEDKFVMYFKGGYVDDPYDGLEFKTEEEEFYYNNGRSHLVFVGDNGFTVKIPIPRLKIFDYQDVRKVAIKAIKYSNSHEGLTDYPLHCEEE
ncbi:MAG: hypothetical protein J6A15_07970 [Clostridia bacterium]|nr:hypothetical protein [Clostridia bacterium]